VPVNIVIDGVAQVSLGLVRVNHAVSDLSSAVGGKPSLWDRWRAAFYASERALFASEGSSGAQGAWRPLTDAYARWKSAHYPGGKILVASGAMRASLVGPGGIYEVTPTQMVIGTERLAGWHKAKGRWAIDISQGQERELFGRALVAWAADIEKEWGKA
jgi:hypothetical protein